MAKGSFPRKEPDGRWYHSFRVDGRGSPQYRRRFDTKADALAFETKKVLQYHQKDKAVGKDKRHLSDLCQLWFDRHGCSLNDGSKRLEKLLAICDRLKDPIAKDFTMNDFTSYRTDRISGKFDKAVKANTVNHEHAYVLAVYNELFRLKEINYENPLSGLRKLKVEIQEMSYLDIEQIKVLQSDLKHNSTNPSTVLVVRICLEVGARWSEAEQLKGSQIRRIKYNDEWVGRITFSKTKSNKSRSIPISYDLYKELKNWMGSSTSASSRLFDNCYDAFCESIKRCKIKLPKGQMTHVLRHTFAAHFMMNGGNILTLNKILGHSKIETTMIYAHFAPDHLYDTLKFKPI